MNKLHELRFPEAPVPEEKKAVQYLYIEADEDHIALQKEEQKQSETKLIYVHEGLEQETLKGKRWKLKNPHYFTPDEGEDNAALWDRVYRYVESSYDLEKVKKIYLGSDGGPWILAGKKRIAGIIHVLDEYHLNKYIQKMIGHLLDSQWDARKEIYDTIRNGKKEEFHALTEKILGYTDNEKRQEQIQKSESYILSNWTAAKLRLCKQKGVIGCSAEGHISHVLSSRMSSRPMAWSRRGASKMSQLRAYWLNGGSMLKLVRYQKEDLPMAAGAEEVILSVSEAMRFNEKQYQKDRYIAQMQASIGGFTAKKSAAIRERIRGL